MTTTTTSTSTVRPVIHSTFDDGTQEIGFLPIGTTVTNQWGKKRTVTNHISVMIDFAPDCPPWG